MGDVVITITDHDKGICTVFKSMENQSGLLSEPQVHSFKKSSRPICHKSRVSRSVNDSYGIKPCEFYRQKLFLAENELHCPKNPEDDYWAHYLSLKRSAGQKVIKKLTVEQKRLEDGDFKKIPVTKLGLDEDYTNNKKIKEFMPQKKKTFKLAPFSGEQKKKLNN